jgi:DNA repair protein RadB
MKPRKKIILETLQGTLVNHGAITLLYGEATAGKTTSLISLTVNHLKQNPFSNAYYIDSDGKLSVDRLIQVTGADYHDVLVNMHVLKPQSFREQNFIISNIDEKLVQEDLLIIDSITGLYRLEAGDPEKTFETNKVLNHYLAFLKELALTKKIAIMISGQVRSVFDSLEGIEPVAPRLLKYWSDIIIKLETTPYPGMRQATLEKPLPIGTCIIEIDANGIREATRLW